MHGGRGRRWAALVVLALLVTVGLTVGFAAYNAGVSHGLSIAAAHAPDLERGAQEGARAVVPPGVPAHGYYAYGYGWHPWGFGFFFGPFLFILFWFVLLRVLFFRAFWWGRGPWRYRDYGYGYGPGPWDRGWHRGGRGFDDWHRRAHERMQQDDEPPAHL